jgi:predicted anti-sigma-YlaC factor YlaD
VECRTAHALTGREPHLAADEHQALEAHLADCPACRDDLADPLGRALAQTTIELALPPPDFTAKLLQRLPQESPLELARQAKRRQRRQQQILIAGVGGGLVAGVGLGASMQPAWAGTALGLAARGILDIAAVFAGPLLGCLVAIAVLAVLLQRALRQSTTAFTLSAAAFACILVLTLGGLIGATDWAQVTAAPQTAAVATLFQPIQAAGTIQGNVASLWGDIVVDGQVSGHVVSVLGDVTLRPSAIVHGDVLAGSGELRSQSDQVAGVERRGVLGTTIALRAVGNGTEQLSPGVVRGLTGLLGALIMLALAGVVVLLWPQRTIQTSRVLPTRPWLALGTGIIITALLALLTLPLLALLALTVVGLLLVPLLLLLLHLPYIQGLAAVGQALGARLTGNVTTGSALWGVAAQLLVVIGLGLIMPTIGLAAFYLLASLGLGAQLIERRSGWAL